MEWILRTAATLEHRHGCAAGGAFLRRTVGGSGLFSLDDRQTIDNASFDRGFADESRYFADTDTLYILFHNGEVAETRDLDENTLVEFDATGKLCAITVEHARDQAQCRTFPSSTSPPEQMTPISTAVTSNGKARSETVQMDASQIGKRAWGYAGVLQDAGLSCFEYVEQLTLLLFLKMADQLTEPPHNRAPIVPPELGWKALLPLDGAALEDQYRTSLEKLGAKPGMLGIIFKGARLEIHNPALLKQLIVNLLDKVDWLSLPVDVKGTIYEELLSRSAQESSRGAGQYFTPRPVIQAMCEAIQPTPGDTICDPAAGTGGFLCNAYQYVLDRFGPDLDADQKRALQEDLVEGVELSLKVGRMCAMNLYLHGIGGEKVVVHTGRDSLAAPWSREYSMVLANPPFGKKQSVMFVNEKGDTEKEDQVVVREDFWTSTGNKQLNFVQHIYTLLKIDGRAAVVVPDNVLFEGGAGEKVRRNLLQKCRVHTLLRLPTGIWYSPGVKANVIFFDKKEGRGEPWTDRLWVYDLRTNLHFTLKQSPIRRADFEEFVECYKPGRMHDRAPTWSDENPDGRWRYYDYEDLLKRDKLSLDLFWIKDRSLTDADALPAPDVLAAEIADDLEAALEQFTRIASRLGPTGRPVAGA